MVLLHAALSKTSSPNWVNDVMDDIEKSMEIFSVMSPLAVARRSAEMIADMLEVAKSLHMRRQREQGTEIDNSSQAPGARGHAPLVESSSTATYFTHGEENPGSDMLEQEGISQILWIVIWWPPL